MSNYTSLNWTQPTLINGWESVPPVSQPSAVLSYSRTADGFVVLRGAVTTSSPSSPTAFYLPEHLRPRYEIELSQLWAINPSGFQPLWVQIKSDGRVNLQNVPVSWYWGCLDGLSFHLGI